jgi:hypothetical protein
MNLDTPIITLILAIAATLGSARAEELTSHPTKDTSPIEVSIQVVLLDLETIDGAQQSFTANFGYAARWNDPRLRHEGPGQKTVPLKDIWHPRLQIVNRRSLQSTFPDEARISPEGDVVMVQRVWGQFSQALILHEFPFDDQTLHANLVGAGHQEGSVIFIPDAENVSAVSDQLAISDWKVTSWNAEPRSLSIGTNGRELPGFRLRVQVKRNHRYHLVNTIFPLILIICMSWVVFWINPKNANPRFSISVTAMLTLIAYRFAVSSSLPKISYLTRMDWFILGSSLLIFGALLEVVVTSWLADIDRLDSACRVNRWMRCLVPLAFFAVAFGSLF